MEIQYRTFRNSDPPHLVDVWRSQPPERALAQPASVDLFDELLFAKQYFDPQGITLAFDGELPVGFAHAAFGSNESGNGVDRTLGVTHLVMVRPHYQRRGIGRELLARSEAYLAGRGAAVLYAGGVGQLNGFYVGLYGGSELPGVLDSSPGAQQLFQTNGYREIDPTIVFQRDTTTFRPPIDRRLMAVRRNTNFRVEFDPPTANWWQASTYGCFTLVRYTLDLKQPAVPEAAVALAWFMEPFSTAWGVHAAGFVDVQVRPEFHRQGLAMFLIGEAMQHLRQEGISLIEVQTMSTNSSAQGLYRKLGFHAIDQGAVYRKG